MKRPYNPDSDSYIIAEAAAAAMTWGVGAITHAREALAEEGIEPPANLDALVLDAMIKSAPAAAMGHPTKRRP